MSVNLSFEEKEKRSAGAESNRGPAAYQPNALPLGQTDVQVDLVDWVGVESQPSILRILV